MNEMSASPLRSASTAAAWSRVTNPSTGTPISLGEPGGDHLDVAEKLVRILLRNEGERQVCLRPATRGARRRAPARAASSPRQATAASDHGRPSTQLRDLLAASAWYSEPLALGPLPVGRRDRIAQLPEPIGASRAPSDFAARLVIALASAARSAATVRSTRSACYLVPCRDQRVEGAEETSKAPRPVEPERRVARSSNAS